MNRTHVLESLSSAQLRPVGLNVVLEIEDESDYVFVGDEEDVDVDIDLLGNDDDDDDVDIDWDEVSYDRCDLSPSLSCATSVATNITLKDLNLTATSSAAVRDSDAAVAMLVPDDPMDIDEECDGTNDPMRAGISMTTSSNANAVNNYFAVNPKSGRRLSNKKLRKKIKNMKKAAAARALAEQKATANANLTGTPSVAIVSSMMSLSSSSEDESKMQEKKPRAVSIDCT